MELILADASSITPNVREYLIEYLVRHPNTQLCVTDAGFGVSRHEITNKLLDMKVPFDMLITNNASKFIPSLTFKTMMLTSVLDQPDTKVILVVDTDQEVLDMSLSAGIPFVYNPLLMGSEYV